MPNILPLPSKALTVFSIVSAFSLHRRGIEKSVLLASPFDGMDKMFGTQKRLLATELGDLLFHRSRIQSITQYIFRGCYRDHFKP